VLERRSHSPTHATHLASGIYPWNEFTKSCDTLGIWHTRGMIDSCGLHDIQSVFRLAMQQYVGEGNLDSRNAIQLLHVPFFHCTMN
jgi:hypothetical protein